MDTMTYASYGAFRALAAREARILLRLEPQFTPFDLSFLKGSCCLCSWSTKSENVERS